MRRHLTKTIIDSNKNNIRKKDSMLDSIDILWTYFEHKSITSIKSE